MRYYTSDLHFGHQLVAETRGFVDDPDEDWVAIADHDNTVLSSLLDLNPKGDQLWILGDLSGGSKRMTERALKMLAGVPVPMHLIPGNHCPVHPMHRDSWKWQRRYLDVFESIQPFARHRFHVDGARHDVLLSHFPYDSKKPIEPTWTPNEWRELAEYPGYSAHPSGAISGRFGRPLKPWVMPNGYHQVTISGIGKRYVHRLVAEAFHGAAPFDGAEVAHNNGVRADNRAINLRWCTREENRADQLRHGSRGPLLTMEDVDAIRSSIASPAELADQFGVSQSHLAHIQRGDVWCGDGSGDHTEYERYPQYRLPDLGRWLLHGHTHSHERVQERQIHVGWDAWGRPVSEDEIADIMRGSRDD